MDTQQLISQLGGPTVIGRQLQIRPQAVSHWVVRGRVPTNRIPTLIRMAKEKGLEVDPRSIRADVDWDALR
jgi:hypothetical protein